MTRLQIGIDEVGRGCWAGPLVVGVVALDKPIHGLTDSKALTKQARELLSKKVQSSALLCVTGWVWPDEVDRLGLTAATTLAIERALDGVTDYDEIIIDGSVNFLPNNPKANTLIKADSLIPAVSAASIVAKVARDRYMADQSITYPGFGFETHVGYGTAKHIEAILDHGVTPLHRLSYKPIRRIIHGNELSVKTVL